MHAACQLSPEFHPMALNPLISSSWGKFFGEYLAGAMLPNRHMRGQFDLAR